MRRILLVMAVAAAVVLVMAVPAFAQVGGGTPDFGCTHSDDPTIYDCRGGFGHGGYVDPVSGSVTDPGGYRGTFYYDPATGEITRTGGGGQGGYETSGGGIRCDEFIQGYDCVGGDANNKGYGPPG